VAQRFHRGDEGIRLRWRGAETARHRGRRRGAAPRNTAR
jgi:hypothetical protein